MSYVLFIQEKKKRRIRLVKTPAARSSSMMPAGPVRRSSQEIGQGLRISKNLKSAKAAINTGARNGSQTRLTSIPHTSSSTNSGGSSFAKAICAGRQAKSPTTLRTPVIKGRNALWHKAATASPAALPHVPPAGRYPTHKKLVSVLTKSFMRL